MTLRATAQSGALVLLAAAGASLLALAGMSLVATVLLLGAPAFGLIGAAAWPMVRACLKEALGQPPQLLVPGWAWMVTGGMLLGLVIT